MTYILALCFLILTIYAFCRKKEYVLAVLLVGQPILKLMVRPFGGNIFFLIGYYAAGFFISRLRYLGCGKIQISSRKMIIVLTTFLIGIVLLVSSMYSPARANGISKTVSYFSTTFLIIFAFITELKSKDDLKKCYSALANTALAMAIITEVIIFLATGSFIARVSTSKAAELNFFGVSLAVSIWYGRRTGIGFLASLFALREKQSLANFIRSALLFLLTILSVSRGPILMLLVCFATFFLLTSKTTATGKRLLTFFLIVLIGFSLVSFINIDFSAFNRLGNNDQNVTSRMVMYREALTIFKKHPLGIGFGGFAAETSTIHEYPHNLFLEILAELGIIGALVFLYFVVASVYSYVKNKGICTVISEKEMNDFALLILLFALGNSMFSGDVGSNEYVGFSFALVRVIPLLSIKEYHEHV